LVDLGLHAPKLIGY